MKIVFLQRNPKDTWVSTYNHTHTALGTLSYQGTWDQFFHLMMTSGCESFNNVYPAFAPSSCIYRQRRDPNHPILSLKEEVNSHRPSCPKRKGSTPPPPHFDFKRRGHPHLVLRIRVTPSPHLIRRGWDQPTHTHLVLEAKG